MRHDVDVGLRFLRWLYPQGPWAMTAIFQDQDRPIETITFRPGKEEAFGKWLADRNTAQWNVYYSVNLVTHDIDKKAKREDIAQMTSLHVDVDPRTGESLESEHVRIRALFDSRLPSGVPRPSGLVFSGGGYNGLWRLQESIPIAAPGLTAQEVEARYEEAKRYNLQLEILFGGDNCHNVDRILRLPGTVNWPNPKKRKQGRTPSVSEIVWLDDARYPVSMFVAAPIIQKGGGSRAAIEISGNVQRLSHVNDLGDAVSDKIKMIIVQGLDPDEPNKYPGSRSEWLFNVVCALVRAKVPDETVYAVITDPGFLISASVLDKGSGMERYALRQIKRAHEMAVDPALCRLNDRHWVVGNTGGKCRVFEEITDHALNRPQLTAQSFEDFRNRYMAEKIQIGVNKSGGPILAPLGLWWLQNTERRQYDTLVFLPNREIPGAYNMWQGFTCEAKPGDKHQRFVDHIKRIVCRDVQSHFDYLIKWMARAVQKPDTQGEVAIVFRGEMGAGKGTVAVEFGKIWGRHFLQVSDPKHLVGSFNLHLRDAVIVFADEAFYAGDKKHESILKTMITEDLLAIEGKGKDVVTSRNYVHLMMASNAGWVIPAGPNERRYLVLDVLPTMMRDFGYFSRIRDDMADGGRENFLHYLLTMDISDFNVRDVPSTQGLQEQKVLSLSTEQEWWYRKLDNGALLKHHLAWGAPVFCDDLIDDYLLYAQKLGHARRATATAIGRFLHTVTPPGYPRKKQHSKQYENKDGGRMTERAYAYEFPPLSECRRWWDEKFGGPYPWTPEENQPNGAEELHAVF